MILYEYIVSHTFLQQNYQSQTMYVYKPVHYTGITLYMERIFYVYKIIDAISKILITMHYKNCVDIP